MSPGGRREATIPVPVNPSRGSDVSASYRFPADDDDRAELERHRRQVAELRRAWLDARTDRDLALHRFYAAVRAELLAEAAFRAVALDEDTVGQ